jgi:hypothetical protein
MKNPIKEIIFLIAYFVVYKILGFETTAIILLSQIFYQSLTK